MGPRQSHRTLCVILTLGVGAERTSFVVCTTTSGWKESQSQSDLLLAAAGGSAVTMETCKACSRIKFHD